MCAPPLPKLVTAIRAPARQQPCYQPGVLCRRAIPLVQIGDMAKRLLPPLARGIAKQSQTRSNVELNKSKGVKQLRMPARIATTHRLRGDAKSASLLGPSGGGGGAALETAGLGDGGGWEASHGAGVAFRWGGLTLIRGRAHILITGNLSRRVGRYRTDFHCNRPSSADASPELVSFARNWLAS